MIEVSSYAADSIAKRHYEQENSWRNTEVLLLKTGEQHHDARPSSPQEFFDTFIAANRALTHLPEWHERFLPDGRFSPRLLKRAMLVQRAITHTERQKRIASLMDAPHADPHTLLPRLVARHPQGTFVACTHTSERAAFVEDIQKAIRISSRRQLVSISDSHRTTADTFEAMRADHWRYAAERTAVLSFDHHTDTYEIPFVGPQKANVMRWLLEKNYIQRLGVVGTQSVDPENHVEGADFIEGDTFYRKDDSPSYEAFEAQIHPLLWDWSIRGITEIYLSIDLDSLCLDTGGYTSTDYGIERRQWECLRRLARAEPFLPDPTLRPDLRERVWGSIAHALDHFPIQQRPYQGIPAAWILKTIRIAKEAPFKFHLGIKDGRTGKRLIGDITELSGPDRRHHGERITLSLLDAVIKESVRV